VLVAVVVLLGLGGAWLVVAGEDTPDATRAQSRRPTTTAPTTATTGPAGLGNLRAVETNDGGVQLDWDGPEAAYTVRVLATDAPPRELPGGPATALMVPKSLLTSTGGLCFEVTPSRTGNTAGAAATTTTAATSAGAPTTPAGSPAATTATTAATGTSGASTPATTAGGATVTTAPAGTGTGNAPIDCVRGATPGSVRRQ
jgi:hypothetical protein